MKIDYTNQVAENHFLQVGAEGRFRDINYKQAYGVDGPGFLLNPGVEQWIPNHWQRNPTGACGVRIRPDGVRRL